MSEIRPIKKLSYIPSLDGIRGLFCILITLNHWPLLLPFSPIGYEGLQVFFIMSGFLIGRILLYERDKHPGFGSYIKRFYWRRTLRIFPLYFIYLFACLIARAIFTDIGFVQESTAELANNWQYYFTYTSNLKTLFNPSAVDTPFFGHLWSLGLEEQFYLVMPFLIFTLRGKALKIAVIAIILIPFITRPLGYHLLTQHYDNEVWAGILVYRNLFFQCDSFAIGAALAIFDFKWIKHPKRWFYILVMVYVGLLAYNQQFFADYAQVLIEKYDMNLDLNYMEILYVRLLGLPELLPMANQHFYMMPLVNVIGGLMCLAAIRGNSVGKRFFEHRLMVDIGRVTYGMYVFHFGLIIVFTEGLKAVLGKGMVEGNILLHIPIYIAYLIILYFMAKLSFKYIEGPFLKIKNKMKPA